MAATRYLGGRISRRWDGRHDNWDGGPRATPWPIRAEAA